MFMEQVIEIDLDKNLRKERCDPGEQICIYVPFTYKQSMYFTLRRVRSRFGGERRYFVCRYCNKNKLKLYTLMHSRTPSPIACRQCHGLKYDSQYGSQIPPVKLARIRSKMLPLFEDQLLIYGGRPTIYGKRIQKLAQKYDLMKPRALEWVKVQVQR